MENSSNNQSNQRGFESREQENETKVVKYETANLSSTNCNAIAKRNLVLLKTLRVRVRGTNGKEEEVRLLLDDGSQQSYIATALAKRLECKKMED